MKISKTKWHKLLSRADVDATTIAQIDLVFYEIARQAGIKNQEFLFSHLTNRTFTHYTNIDFKELGRFVYQKYLNHPARIKEYYKRGKKFLKQTESRANYWQKRIKQEQSYDNLSRALLEFNASFQEANYFYSIISWVGIESWQADFDEIVDKLIIRNKLTEQREKIIFSIYKPWQQTALIEVQKKLAKKCSLATIVKQYQFLRNWAAVWYKPIDRDWFTSLEKTGQTKNWRIYSLSKIISLLRPNKPEEKFLKLASYIVFFKDWRDDLRRRQVYSWSFLFDQIANKFKIEHDDLGYLTIKEMREALRSKQLNLDIIKDRKKGCVVTVNQGKNVKILSSAGLKRYIKLIQQVNSQKTRGLIKGLIAQGGLVRGRVRIVRSPHGIKHVKTGDILVANTTHPDYLPAMHKAIAFITNEGGVISHAAIVAREMKKPCLVGTGNATKVLHDGDLVEVDANNGVVKVL